ASPGMLAVLFHQGLALRDRIRLGHDGCDPHCDGSHGKHGTKHLVLSLSLSGKVRRRMSSGGRRPCPGTATVGPTPAPCRYSSKPADEATPRRRGAPFTTS